MKKILIIGAGGHGLSTYGLIRSIAEYEVSGFLDDTKDVGTVVIDHERVIGSIESFLQMDSLSDFYFALGIGGPWPLEARNNLFDKFVAKKAKFPSLIHPQSNIDDGVQISGGVQVHAGVSIRIRAKIGSNCLLNTGSSIDHESKIGANSVISPGVTICGQVNIGESCLIGAGATILQKLTVGHKSVVAAGSLVRIDVPSNTRVQGVPAQPYRG